MWNWRKRVFFLKTHRAWFQEERKVEYSVKDEMKQNKDESSDQKKKGAKEDISLSPHLT